MQHANDGAELMATDEIHPVKGTENRMRAHIAAAIKEFTGANQDALSDLDIAHCVTVHLVDATRHILGGVMRRPMTPEYFAELLAPYIDHVARNEHIDASREGRH